MSMSFPVRHALLRDGPAWGCALPASLQRTDEGDLLLAGGSSSALLESGRLDAGIDSDWERVRVRARVPAGCSVEVHAFTTADANAAPQWTTAPAPGLDFLLDRVPGPAPAQVGSRRYLWLRVRLARSDAAESPVLEQVHAQTRGRSYLEDLPAIYRRDDRPTRFLERWLALFRSDLEGFEEILDGMPRLFDPRMARADRLAWVAQSLGFEPPPHLNPAGLRALLERVPNLYANRGTIAGLADWAQVYSGLRPTILDAWRSRRVWQLGATSRVGFDTMLAGGSPDGVIVPGDPRTDPGYLGLLRETFGGAAFESANGLPRIDRNLDFTGAGALALAPKDVSGLPLQVATLRWSGQLRPRYPERYALTLRVAGANPGDDVRLRFWIDGRPLIEDLWIDATAGQGVVPNIASVARDVELRMEELRWYPLRLEVRTTATTLAVSLAWSSRSQRPEPIPPECLYARADDNADTGRTEAGGFDVGSAVVGASGPQGTGDFGQALFADSAHLFTVLVPPACDCGGIHGSPQQRLREAIEAEKPAHTDFHLCFLKPRLRVGFQARLGIDAIVADGPPAGRWNQLQLGRDSFLAGPPPARATTKPQEEAPWTP